MDATKLMNNLAKLQGQHNVVLPRNTVGIMSASQDTILFKWVNL